MYENRWRVVSKSTLGGRGGAKKRTKGEAGEPKRDTRKEAMQRRRPGRSKVAKKSASGGHSGVWASYLPSHLAAVGGRGEVNFPPRVEEKREAMKFRRTARDLNTPWAEGPANFFGD